MAEGDANSVPNRPTPLDYLWAKRYKKYLGEELDQVRASATKWQTSLTALSGLLITGLALSAPYLASSISSSLVRWTVIIGVVITLVMLASAGWKATVAAAGIPEGVNGSGEFREAVLKKVDESKDSLKSARMFYAIGQVCLIFTVGLAVLLSPVKSETLAEAAVVLHDGRQMCGALQQNAPAGTLVLTTANGSVEQVQLSDVAVLQPVRNC